MYNTCYGKTVPYWPEATSGGSSLHTFVSSRVLLAVWPRDAEIALVPTDPKYDIASQRKWAAPKTFGPRGHQQLAALDIDGDARPEFLVLESWANDYGLLVFANGATAPRYGFSCGNI